MRRPPASGRDQRGVSLSAFTSVIVFALIAVAGLVVDGGSQLAADRECSLVAAEAARAASDKGAAARAGGATPDTSEMQAAGDAVIAAHAPMTGVVVVTGHEAVAETHLRTATTFLTLFGIGGLDSSATARVQLRGSGD